MPSCAPAPISASQRRSRPVTARRRGRGARPGLLEAASGRPGGSADGLGWLRRACLCAEVDAVEVPGELDAAEVVSLVLPYMTAYQLLHRTARVKSGETALVHGGGWQGGHRGSGAWSAGRARLYGTASGATGPRSSAGRCGDRLPQRGLPGAGARASRRGKDVVLDGLGGALSLRSFRALRPGGRLVVFGHYAMLALAVRAGAGGSSGTRRPRAWRSGVARPAGGWPPTISRSCAGPPSAARGWTSPSRCLWVEVPATPSGSVRTSLALLELLAADKIHLVVAERLPLADARRARMSCWSSPRPSGDSFSCHEPTRTPPLIAPEVRAAGRLGGSWRVELGGHRGPATCPSPSTA